MDSINGHPQHSSTFQSSVDSSVTSIPDRAFRKSSMSLFRACFAFRLFPILMFFFFENSCIHLRKERFLRFCSVRTINFACRTNISIVTVVPGTSCDTRATVESDDARSWPSNNQQSLSSYIIIDSDV